MAKTLNETLVVIGYGSLLSGYGMLAERRGGKSRLVARDAFPVRLLNARRGLAKPSSHGHYLAMDLEPIDATMPISAHPAGASREGIGALGLVFDREWAPLISRREEYDERKFVALIEHADRAGQSLGEFLLAIAPQASFFGRAFDASPDEVSAATIAVSAALASPLMRRAASATIVRREAPLLLKMEAIVNRAESADLPASTMVEGVADLAFVEDRDGSARWIVVDFKTDFDLDRRGAEYRTQLALYLRAITRATAMPANGYLLLT